MWNVSRPHRCSPRGFFSVRAAMLARYGAAQVNGMRTENKDRPSMGSKS